MEDIRSYARPKLTVLDSEQLNKLHEASLVILAETGVNVHAAEIRALLEDAGAEVQDALRVRISPELVAKALTTAPSRIDIYDRSGDKAMILEGANCYFGTGSDLEYTVDRRQQRRRSTLKDVERSARLCEKLSNIDFVMSYALPSEVPPLSIELEQLRVLLSNTTKPIIMTVFSGMESFEQVHKLACKSCGGETHFRQAPNYIVYGQFVSPLQHDADALDRLIFSADHHIPLIYVPTIMMGVSGPVTLAGALALANAECLAGLVMHQLRAPGAPFIYGGCVSPLDMKTTVFAYGSPEWRLADAALSQLSLRYDLPIFGTGGATDAKTPDAQAGAEWAYSLLTCALAGTNLIHDVGYLESGLTGSLESLVVCDEIIGMVKRVISGFKLDEETLALNMIKRVGPAGHFIGEEHTLERYRKDVWYPSLFARNRYESWQAEGGKALIQYAGERVEELLT
jgi:trimethylamine--corrinoid protein Co-methyltransferase